jgi:hypothetical protein
LFLLCPKEAAKKKGGGCEAMENEVEKTQQRGTRWCGERASEVTLKQIWWGDKDLFENDFQKIRASSKRRRGPQGELIDQSP